MGVGRDGVGGWVGQLGWVVGWVGYLVLGQPQNDVGKQRSARGTDALRKAVGYLH